MQNVFAAERSAVVRNAAHSETYIEAYYNVYVTQWMQIQPVVQVVANPGGVHTSTEVILGVHVALRF